MEDYVYHKINESKSIFLVLYVDGILIASNNVGVLRDTKRFLERNFKMKDLGDASFVLGIKTLRDHSQGILRLSQNKYIIIFLSIFGLKNCAPRDTLVAKGVKFHLGQCPNTTLDIKKM